MTEIDADVREATEGDIEELAALYAEFFAEDAIDTADIDLDSNIRRMIRDSRARIWVAVHDGEIAGLASASLTYGVEFGSAAEIEDLYVTPEARGKGLARRLFETALAWSEAAGAAEILLVITPEAEAAQSLTKLYRRFGFRDSRRIVMYSGGGENADAPGD